MLHFIRKALVCAGLILLPAGAVSETLRIGALVCLSGECAEWGSNSLKGIELAAAELNARGGVLGQKVEIVAEDTAEGEGGAGAVTAFQNLSNKRDIHFYIGPSWTTGGLSVAPIVARRKGIIMTSPSLGVAEFNEAAPHLFNTWPHDEYATKAMARYASEQGWRRGAIFSSQQPWESLQGNTFEAEFKQLGGIIASKQEPVPSILDLRTEVLRLIKQDPEFIFLCNFNQMGIGAKQLRVQGYKGPLLAILMDESRIKSAGDALDGTIFARYPDPDLGFVQQFKIKFGESPGVTADTAYDTLHLYAKAIAQVGSLEIEKVQAALLNMTHKGASGEIVFDSKGGVRKDPVLYQVKGTKMMPFQPSERGS
ncbi:MAG: hypothetical protein DCC75_06255 [Proteobacteria bacterium]|nr:MAG: hypothetical protein DCC75_06255 [Pseudomonadota bacterium]